MKVKVLFITRNIGNNFGGGIVTSRNIKCLKKINNIELYTIFLNKTINKTEVNDYYIISSKSKYEIFLNSIFLFDGQLNFRSEKIILNIIKEIKPDIIFYDGSYYGRIIKQVKYIKKNIKQVTYFHNVEVNLNKDLMKVKGLLYFPIYCASKFNEKLAVKYSDVLIAINHRDSIEIKKIYKKNINYIVPVTLEDKFNNDKAKIALNKKNAMLRLVFIGSNFFPNYHGIKWFVEQVMPKVNNCVLFIVGKGFENCKELERDNVIVIGQCENVEEYYYDSDIFVSPIFYGSGMKVKTAEAMMYGKTIIATKESLAGYDNINIKEVGFLCESSDDFINSLNCLKTCSIENLKINQKSRETFLKYYSDEVALKTFSDIFTKNL